MSGNNHGDLSGCWVIVLVGFIASLIAIPLNTLQLMEHFSGDESAERVEVQNNEREPNESEPIDTSESQEPIPVQSEQAQEDSVQEQIEEISGNDSANLQQPVAPPANYSCPSVAGASWLQNPQYWYGPYRDRYGYINYISYDSFNVYVTNSYFGTTFYNDPASFGGRNQWWPLNTAPFNICVDQQGRVFVYFSG